MTTTGYAYPSEMLTRRTKKLVISDDFGVLCKGCDRLLTLGEIRQSEKGILSFPKRNFSTLWIQCPKCEFEHDYLYTELIPPMNERIEKLEKENEQLTATLTKFADAFLNLSKALLPESAQQGEPIPKKSQVDYEGVNP